MTNQYDDNDDIKLRLENMDIFEPGEIIPEVKVAVRQVATALASPGVTIPKAVSTFLAQDQTGIAAQDLTVLASRPAPAPAPYVEPPKEATVEQTVKHIFVGEAAEGDPYVGRRTQWGLKGTVPLATLRAEAPKWLLPLVPEEVTPKKALFKAVMEICKSKGIFHEKHPKGGWAICSVKAKGVKDEATLDLRVKCRLYLDERNFVAGEVENMDAQEFHDLVLQVNSKVSSELCSELDTTEISTLLTKAVQTLNGVGVIRRGSYYIPPEGVARWQSLVDCFDKISGHFIENAGVIRTDSRFFTQLLLDITAEFDDRLKEMTDELNQEVVKRVVGYRLTELDTMKSKAEQYAKLLGLGMNTIVDRITETRAKFANVASRGALLEV